MQRLLKSTRTRNFQTIVALTKIFSVYRIVFTANLSKQKSSLWAEQSKAQQHRRTTCKHIQKKTHDVAFAISWKEQKVFRIPLNCLNINLHRHLTSKAGFLVIEQMHRVHILKAISHQPNSKRGLGSRGTEVETSGCASMGASRVKCSKICTSAQDRPSTQMSLLFGRLDITCVLFEAFPFLSHQIKKNSSRIKSFENTRSTGCRRKTVFPFPGTECCATMEDKNVVDVPRVSFAMELQGPKLPIAG